MVISARRVALLCPLLAWLGGGCSKDVVTPEPAVGLEGTGEVDSGTGVDSGAVVDSGAAADAGDAADAGAVPDSGASMDPPDASVRPDGGTGGFVESHLKFQCSGPISVTLDEAGAPVIVGGLINASRFDSITLAAQPVPGTSVTAADLFVVKFNPGGRSSWGARYGDEVDQLGSAVAVSQSVVLVVGQFSGSLRFSAGLTLTSANEIAFLAALDRTTGDALWAKPLDLGPGGFVLGLASDPQDQGFLVAATASAAVSFGTFSGSWGGGKDLFVTKVKGNGDLIWARQIGGVGDQIARAVAADAMGSAFVVGQFGGALNFGGGAFPTPSTGRRNMFVAKLDTATGATVQAIPLGSAGTQLADAVAVDASGNVVIAGYLAGSTITFNATPPIVLTAQGQDGFVAKLAADLSGTLWARRIGDVAKAADGGTSLPALPQQATGVAVDRTGKVVVVGVFQGTVDFGPGAPTTARQADAFALKLDGASGSPVWLRSTGGSVDEKATGVGINRHDDSIWVVGTFTASTLISPIPNWGGAIATELVFPMDDGSQTHTFQVQLAP